jgi:DNA-binding response OmpR family regulator
MDSDRCEQIRRSLRMLAESHAATVDFFQQALQLIDEEFSLDPATYFRRTTSRSAKGVATSQLQIDPTHLSVTFRGKTCFLGNTYPFHVLLHLAHKRNTFVSHQELFEAVWHGIRSDAALRSTIKLLRRPGHRAGVLAVPG